MRKAQTLGVFLLTLSLNLWAATPPVITPEFVTGSTRVNAERFIELVGEIPKLILIDSRIRADRKQGYIEGSQSLPDIKTDCDSLSQHIPRKNAPVLFYCNGVKCGRSGKAVKIAVDCGYNNIYWFRGGFKEWLAKGYPYLRE